MAKTSFFKLKSPSFFFKSYLKHRSIFFVSWWLTYLCILERFSSRTWTSALAFFLGGLYSEGNYCYWVGGYIWGAYIWAAYNWDFIVYYDKMRLLIKRWNICRQLKWTYLQHVTNLSAKLKLLDLTDIMTEPAILLSYLYLLMSFHNLNSSQNRKSAQIISSIWRTKSVMIFFYIKIK